MRALDPAVRQLIFQCIIELGWTADRVYDTFYQGVEVVTLEHIKKLERGWKNPAADPAAIGAYVSGTSLLGRTGRPKFLDEAGVQLLIDLHGALEDASPLVLREELADALGINENDISTRSINRYLLQNKLTMKRPEFYSKEAEPEDTIAHLRATEPYHPRCMVNFDATDCNQKKFRPRRGRSLVGTPCIFKEYLTTFGQADPKARRNILAVLGYDGWRTWQNREGTTDAVAVREFFLTHVAPIFDTDEDVCLFDNASVNVEGETLATIDAVTAQRWKRVPPYSPRMSPVEHGFALVWCEVRKHWREAAIDPNRIIDEAFAKYAQGTEGGHIITGLWNVYLRSHQEFLGEDDV